jgi:hypothetical protein
MARAQTSKPRASSSGRRQAGSAAKKSPGAAKKAPQKAPKKTAKKPARAKAQPYPASEREQREGVRLQKFIASSGVRVGRSTTGGLSVDWLEQPPRAANSVVPIPNTRKVPPRARLNIVCMR